MCLLRGKTVNRKDFVLDVKKKKRPVKKIMGLYGEGCILRARVGDIGCKKGDILQIVKGRPYKIVNMRSGAIIPVNGWTAITNKMDKDYPNAVAVFERHFEYAGRLR